MSNSMTSIGVDGWWGEAGSATVPGQPSIFDIKYITHNSARVYFNFNADTDSFKVYKDGVVVATGITDFYYDLGDLDPNTTYSITIYATNDWGDSVVSEAETFDTLSAPTGEDVSLLSNNAVPVVTISGNPRIVGSGSAKVFDPRVKDDQLSNEALTYYWRDIQENEGKAVTPG